MSSDSVPVSTRIWRALANRLVRSSTVVKDDVRNQLPAALRATSGIAARFDPTKAVGGLIISAPPAMMPSPSDGYGFPVPPPDLWRCFEGSAGDYLDSGRKDTETMREVLATAGYPIEAARSVLDFGCAAGRMTRWLVDCAPGREIWGVDIHGQSIAWCREQLSPPFHFMLGTTLPHLPFADHSFDVIGACSVVGQMPELRDAWMLELRRVLSPDGVLYVTLSDRNSVDAALSFAEDHKFASFGRTVQRAEENVGLVAREWSTATIMNEDGSAHTFYDLDAFRTLWDSVFEIKAIRPHAFSIETGLVLAPR